MATGATSPFTWRTVFGNTETWARPEDSSRSSIPAVSEAADTWRVIFGNTSAWLPPQLESPAALGEKALERCELCRQLIGPGEDFTTNSAGERPTHTRCLGLGLPAAGEPPPALCRWLSVLRELVNS
jgi:hypothetical protein